MTIANGTSEITRPIVIALHCSGSNGQAWRKFEQILGNQVSLITPDLTGYGGSEAWSGTRAFTASDEAALTVDIIEAMDKPVHLIGHSYGGGVALRAARERPDRIASLTLYEPTPFHVLNTMGGEGREAFAEVESLASEIDQAVLTGAYHAAAERFADYWNGAGSWSAMPSDARDGLIRNLPKVCLEFRAMMQERTPMAAYRRFNFPVLLLQSEQGPRPTHLMSRQLARAIKLASLRYVSDAGHMGLFTHADAIGTVIAAHVDEAEQRMQAISTPFDPRAAA